MDREVVTSVEDDHGSVRAVELGDGLAALDALWVAGNCDDVVEDDVLGQQVEEVPTIGNAIEALLDGAKERVERLEVVKVGDRRRHDGSPLCPRVRGSPGEVSELDRRRSSELLDASRSIRSTSSVRSGDARYHATRSCCGHMFSARWEIPWRE